MSNSSRFEKTFGIVKGLLLYDQESISVVVGLTIQTETLITLMFCFRTFSLTFAPKYHIFAHYRYALTT